MSAKQLATWIPIAAVTLGLEAAATHPGRQHHCIVIASGHLMFSVTRKKQQHKETKKVAEQQRNFKPTKNSWYWHFNVTLLPF